MPYKKYEFLFDFKKKKHTFALMNEEKIRNITTTDEFLEFYNALDDRRRIRLTIT